ncbi:TetR/AcrR family transcriptional regulator [Sporichthya polymorpha]|uniref:TetR/AcrR family transcriptional regulator n=1 Tax=Sporichthya polymorpha TaxID=35751 RepID=UPI00036D717A|nr:TetR/AcrR family transcriptional regulator [Sporichthya polymorpha]
MTTAAPRNGKKRIDSKQRRREIRDRLLAAIDALAADGDTYSTVSVEKLATTAGISRATFYIYFEGKADLLQAWFAEILEEFADAADRWWSLGADATPDELATALDAVLDVYLGHAGLMAAINDEATQNDELRATLSGAIQRGIEGTRQHIERGQAEGFVDPDLLAAETSAWLVWLIERGMNQGLGAGDDEQSRLLRSNLTSVIWHVLYAGSPAHRAAAGRV